MRLCDFKLGSKTDSASTWLSPEMLALGIQPPRCEETQTQGKATHGCLGQQTQLGPQPAMASTTRLILEGDLRSGAPSPKPWTSTKYMSASNQVEVAKLHLPFPIATHHSQYCLHHTPTPIFLETSLW